MLITLTNSGSVPLTISKVFASIFTVTINDTGFVIQPGHSTTCNVTISVPPGQTPSTYSSTITFSATG
jgi:uncharacterized membrane protein